MTYRFLFVITEVLWWAGNWKLSTQKFVNQNSFDKVFPCDNPGLARLSYVNIFYDGRTQWSTLKYVDWEASTGGILYSVKKGCLKNFVKFTGKHLFQSLFFNKVAGLALAQVFSIEFCEILKDTFLTEHVRATGRSSLGREGAGATGTASLGRFSPATLWQNNKIFLAKERFPFITIKFFVFFRTNEKKESE